MSFLGVDAAGVKRWQCDNGACRKQSAWTDTWVTFCSLREMDDLGNDVPVFCSRVCGEASGSVEVVVPKKKLGAKPDALARLSKAELVAMLHERGV